MVIDTTTSKVIDSNLEDIYDNLDNISYRLITNGYTELAKIIHSIALQLIQFEGLLEKEPDELDIIDRQNDERKLEELEKCK